MTRDRINTFVLVALACVVCIQLAASLSAPASAYDAKGGSDSATVSVATSADGAHVYICDTSRCYASHDGGRTFTKIKVN